MSQLLGVFSPGFLLRSLFSGAFFCIAFLVATPPSQDFGGIKLTLTSLVGVSLFAGVTTYTFHRSAIYAFLEWGLNSGWAKRLRIPFPLIGRKTIRVLLSQWARAAAGSEISRERARHFSTWADYAHLQYTSALCLLFGAWCGALVSSAKVSVSGPVFFLGVALFVAGVVADWRLHAIREHVELLEARRRRRARPNHSAQRTHARSRP
jgi:hypothetical protein